MSAVNTLKQVQGVVSSIPVTEILEIASSVVCVLPIPGLPLVIKMLTIATKLQRPAVQALGVSSLIASKTEEATMTKRRDDMIQQMIEIACADGVIDEDEEKFLRGKAQQIGMNPDQLMQEVYKRLQQN